ncbi:MAG: TonB-dependent receptor [Tannerellaceae bacterium]|jgi:TonB-linked SusC/RagA family outer membrane protein|nr:TonB-dependent receptor [Tannerellaceae bacterium]
MKRRLTYLLLCLIVGIGFATAQTVRVTGSVIFAEDNEPVIGATIVVKGTTTGTVTAFDGSFSLEVPAGARTLTISYIGMKTQEVPVSPRVNVVLESDSQTIDEVVVVGYGTQKKKDVTSSIARVGGEDLSNLAAPSFESQLAGRAAGVQVTTESGMVGAAPKFQIRGFSTISSGSQPLIIIDGIPMNSGEKQQLYGRYNPLGDINPNDIQSVEILKDGAATAVYGSRAANGVVLITTKKGSKGSVKVTYDGFIGTAQASKLHDLLGAQDFVTIANEKFENWDAEGPAVFDPNGVETNWNDEIFRSALQQSHTIAASGGTDRSQYYASIGYTNMDGIIRSSNQERYTISANVTQQANKWLQIGANIQATRTTLHGAMNGENSLGAVGFAGPRMLPNVSPFNADDITGYNIDAEVRKALGRGANKSYIDNGIQNIVWALDKNLNLTKSARIIGSGFAEITFMEGLTLRTQGGMDYTLLNDFVRWNSESGDGNGYGGYLDEVNTVYYNWNWQNVLNFNRTFNDVHNVGVTAVQEYTHTDYEWTEANVYQLSDKFFSEHIISNTFGEKYIGGYKSSNGLASYLLRGNYNYDSKYYASASVRRDGLSKLPVDTRWGTFVGGSLAWRLSRESFWAESSVGSWFNDLRLRASMATIGNSDLGNASGDSSNDFPYLGTYSGKSFGAQKGIAWSNMGNDRLKWESTTTYDLGVDGTLFDGRLSFEMAYFQKNTSDLVMEVPTPPTLGIPGNSYFDNIGKIKNSGFEFSLSATPVASKGFTWQTDFNISFVKNKVIELLDGQDIISTISSASYNITREGESFQSLYGFDYYGVNMGNGNPIWRKADGSLVQFDTFGSYDYAVYDPNNPADVSNPSSLSATEDRKILGSALPTWFGGFNNTITYKDFDLNIFLRFSGGNKIMNASRPKTLLNMEFANNGTEILGRWQSKEKPGDGMTPRIGYGDDNVLFNAPFADSHFVEDGSFLKLSNVALGYTLPRAISSKIDVSKVRVYLQAQNLLTITGYSGLDPETSSRRGADWDGMPQQRIFTVGANITF